MADDHPVSSFFVRSFARFRAFAEAMEETEVSVLERRIVRLEREVLRVKDVRDGVGNPAGRDS